MPQTAAAIAQQYLAAQSATPAHLQGRMSEIGDTVVVQRILDAVSRGLSITRAADYAGLDRRTLQRWMARADEEPESAYATFVAAYKTCEAEFIDRQHRGMELAAEADPKHWPARMTLLERRFPEEYGRRQDDSSAPRVVVQIGVQGGDVQVAFAPSSAQIQANPPESLAITAGSENVDYVNQRKPLMCASVSDRRHEGQARRTPH